MAWKALKLGDGKVRAEALLERLRRAARLDGRFQRHLDRARAGEHLFDPNAEDSWKLLEAMAAARDGDPGRGARWPFALALLAVIGGAAAADPAEARQHDLSLKVARTMATITHPNIVEVYEVVELSAGLHVVLERVEGGTLRGLLDERGPLPLGEVKRIEPTHELGGAANSRGGFRAFRVRYSRKDLQPSSWSN